MSPFKALYGHDPRHWGITTDTKSIVPSLQAWLEERQVTQDLIQQHLHRARQCMKAHVDKKRSFQVGDQVFLKLQPYIQTSIAPRANHKLSSSSLGHFQLSARSMMLHTNSSYHQQPRCTRSSTFLNFVRPFCQVPLWLRNFLPALMNLQFLSKFFRQGGVSDGEQSSNRCGSNGPMLQIQV